MSRRTAMLDPAEIATDIRICDHPGCAAEATFKAPRDRSLRTYYWFCLQHVREYNAKWNYCAGMSEKQIEAEIRRDTCWQRPSWPLGGRPAPGRADRNGHPHMRDGFGVFGEDGGADGGGSGAGAGANRHGAQGRNRTSAAGPVGEAMSTLGLSGFVDLESLKARYKVLVKKYHPDANGGDRAAEERFKQINAAYCVLRASLNASP